MTQPTLDHEQILTGIGARSGLPIIVAVHSTRLGPALGGCRLWEYDSWLDAQSGAVGRSTPARVTSTPSRGRTSAGSSSTRSRS